MQLEPDVWSAPRRIGFLVLAVFLLFNTVPALAGVVPVAGDLLGEWYAGAWQLVIPWIGANVLGFDYPIELAFNGSGDRTWNWVQAFAIAVLSVVGGTLWAVLDHRREHYAWLHRWLLVLTRYTLASSMLLYGSFKLLKTQFPFPHLAALTSTYGESSPMGLAWRFMGYSDGYNWFTGGAEALAGVLLLWRRTATLGALVAIGVTANILALNLCYDIPVKLYSATLLVMAVYVAASDGRRLIDVFVRNRATAAVVHAPHFTRKGWQTGRRALKAAFIGINLFTVYMLDQMGREYGDGAPRPALYGLYEVEEFARGGVVQPPLVTDRKQWRQFIVETTYVAIRDMQGEREMMMYEVDEAAKLFKLTRFRAGEEPTEMTLGYEEVEGGLVLRGRIFEEDLVVRVKKVDHTQMLLVSRGFRWINEAPFNR